MKVCNQCQQEFEVTDSDRAIIESASPVLNGQKILIPEPTMCPPCRNQRRMAWRNDRTFYHRKCDLTGKQFISMYPADSRFPVYKQDAWHGDDWDPMDYGREYDFGRPFFEQWVELRDVVPHWGVAIANCENSDYCNYCTDEKNCYLDIAAEGNEDCYYNLFCKNSKNVVDSTFVYSSELVYESLNCYDSYNLKWCIYADNCNDCSFCFDMKGCSDCLFSFGLRNKQYCILNVQYSKEDYEQKLGELNMGSYKVIEDCKQKWMKMMKEKAIHRDMWNLNSENSTGNNLKNCRNVAFSFNATNCEDGSYLYDVLDAQDCMDMNYSLYEPRNSYEIMSTVGTKSSAFFSAGPYNSSIYYSQLCQSCSDCFGCVGLKRGQYCILNKQYTQEEYEELVVRIIEHMKRLPYKGNSSTHEGTRSTHFVRSGSKIGSSQDSEPIFEWGEFFPVEFSPHGYNETIAQDYYPLSKEEVLQRGWKWSDREESSGYQGPEHEVSDDICNADDELLGKVLVCQESGKPYKVMKQELAFYKRMGIPIPRRSPHQRHFDRNAVRNSRWLWVRQCAKCQRDVYSSYSTDRSEQVYCEQCYLFSIK